MDKHQTVIILKFPKDELSPNHRQKEQTTIVTATHPSPITKKNKKRHKVSIIIFLSYSVSHQRANQLQIVNCIDPNKYIC